MKKFWWRELPEGSLVECVGSEGSVYEVGALYQVKFRSLCKISGGPGLTGYSGTFVPVEMSLEGIL